MADMTASGWYPSNVKVIRSWRPWGPQAMRHALVKFTMEATNFGGGAHVYPGEGIPVPFPSTVGFRESIEYVIPVQHFYGVTAKGRFLTWGCNPPTYGGSGGTVSTGARIRIGAGLNTSPSQGPSYALEAVSTLAASTLFTTDTMTAIGIFVGK